VDDDRNDRTAAVGRLLDARLAQGLPARVEDLRVVERVADIIRPGLRESRADARSRSES
jgi:hypothetical protein